MKLSYLWLGAWLVVGCSSGGTESGNPSRGCGDVRCVCAPTLTLHVTDSISGMPTGTSITVDGAPVDCDVTGTCLVFEPRFDQKGSYELTISAPDHAPKTVTVVVPETSSCCQCATLNPLDVLLDTSP